MPAERIFVGLGSNQSGPVMQLKQALHSIANTADIALIARSGFYRNPPMGPRNQPDFVNAVAEIATRLTPLVLLDALMAIENRCGRTRGTRHWGPRIIDLDLLLYGERVMNHARLQLPHPGLCHRAFVVHPLFELAPELQIPGCGSLRSLAAGLPGAGLQRVDPPE